MTEAELRALIAALVVALNHVQHCMTCAEEPWQDCPGGRAALDTIRKAETMTP